MNPLHEQYRPTTWDDVIGQDRAIAKIRTVARRGLGGRAFWIAGQSGTGKTTIARLIASDVASDLCTEELDATDLTPAALRDIERRMGEAEAPRPDGTQTPAGIPASFQEHVRIMLDLVVLAFQTDSTRIVMFMLAHEGSNRSFPDIGIPEAHHQLSHHRDKKSWLDRIARIDRFYVSQLRYFIERLSSVEEEGRPLLDQAMVLYGAGISEGNKHWHSDLPTLLAGGGGGSLSPGRHLKFSAKTPMSNLLLALLERMNVQPGRLGDSTGVLADL